MQGGGQVRAQRQRLWYRGKVRRAWPWWYRHLRRCRVAEIGFELDGCFKREGTHDCSSSETASGGWELITLPVSKWGSAACSISKKYQDMQSRRARDDLPEGTIQWACKLRRVTHQCTLISKATVNQSTLYSLDPTIHHITWCNTMDASSSVAHCNFRDTLNRWKCVNRTIVIEETTVSVWGVFAETDVGCYVEIGKLLANEMDCWDDRA